jgi:hypothetical protein
MHLACVNHAHSGYISKSEFRPLRPRFKPRADRSPTGGCSVDEVFEAVLKNCRLILLPLGFAGRKALVPQACWEARF